MCLRCIGEDCDVRGADLIGGDFSCAVHGNDGGFAACKVQCALCPGDGDRAAVSVFKGHLFLGLDDLPEKRLFFKMDQIISV